MKYTLLKFEILGKINNSNIGSRPQSVWKSYARAQQHECGSLSADSRRYTGDARARPPRIAAAWPLANQRLCDILSIHKPYASL